MDWTWLDCIHISFTYIIYYHTRFSQICWILEDSATWKTHSGFSVCCVSDDWNPPHWIEICRGEKTDITCTYVYIYIHETIFTCICILQNILNIHDIHSIAFTLIESEAEKLEAPDRTWWSLKVEEKILGDQGATFGEIAGGTTILCLSYLFGFGVENPKGWSIFAPIGCPCFSFVFVFFRIAVTQIWLPADAVFDSFIDLILSNQREIALLGLQDSSIKFVLKVCWTFAAGAIFHRSSLVFAQKYAYFASCAAGGDAVVVGINQ